MKKILIVSANPVNTSKLRLNSEVREIQSALERSRHREEFELITKLAVRIDDLRRALLDYSPQVVHFSGHGDGINGIALEDNSGYAQLVSTESLSNLFKLFKDTVECVLLNACYSEIQAEAIYEHLNCVIGMEYAIADLAAIHFSTAFYDALGAGRSYKDAFDFGCNNIDLNSIPESLTPKIKIRNNSKTLFSHKEPKSNMKSTQNRSVSIEGNVTSSAIQTGDRNVANVHFQPVSLPAPESVDIRAELNALHEAIALLESPDRRKIDNAFADASEEVNKPKPDKDEVGKALDRAFDYAKRTKGFASVVEKLKPHLIKTTAWLGENWHKLLSIVDLGI